MNLYLSLMLLQGVDQWQNQNVIKIHIVNQFNCGIYSSIYKNVLFTYIFNYNMWYKEAEINFLDFSTDVICRLTT